MGLLRRGRGEARDARRAADGFVLARISSEAPVPHAALAAIRGAISRAELTGALRAIAVVELGKTEGGRAVATELASALAADGATVAGGLLEDEHDAHAGADYVVLFGRDDLVRATERADAVLAVVADDDVAARAEQLQSVESLLGVVVVGELEEAPAYAAADSIDGPGPALALEPPRGSERDAELEAWEKQLAQRADELASRERELEGLAAELQLREAALRPAAADEPDDRDLTALEQELELRLAAVAEREAALDRRAGEAPGSERAEQLDERERTLEARVAAVTRRERALIARTAELARKDRELEARLAEQEQASASKQAAEVWHEQAVERERVFESRAAALDRREAELERREGDAAEQDSALAARAEELDRRAAAVDRLEPPEAARGQGWTLDGLERLVADARDRGAPEALEWEAYVFSLRAHADVEGKLPPQFDSLIESVFGSALPA